MTEYLSYIGRGGGGGSRKIKCAALALRGTRVMDRGRWTPPSAALPVSWGTEENEPKEPGALRSGGRQDRGKLPGMSNA